MSIIITPIFEMKKKKKTRILHIIKDRLLKDRENLIHDNRSHHKTIQRLVAKEMRKSGIQRIRV